MSRVLIKDGCVLTLDPRIGNLRRGDVLIEDGRIAEVGVDLRARDAEVIDAVDSIVMPGLCDTHRHTWESLFRNLGDAGSSADYGPHYEPEDLYAATLIGLLGAAEAGTTTVVDWSDIQIDDRYTDAALSAHADAGMRTVFVYAGAGWAPDDGGWRPGLRRLRDVANSPLTTLAAAPREPLSDLDRAAGDWALARELGLRIHSHAGNGAPRDSVVADLAARNLLGGDVTLVHCSDLEDAELDVIASSGTSVALTPSSEMAGGFLPPVQKLIDRGIRPGLGVDRERVSPGDIFAQMRAAISLQHAHSFDLKLAGKAGLPRMLTTREVIRYATIDGARAVGLGGVTGSLEPGKQADIIILGTDRPNIFPINDPIGAVVWGMDTSNVDWVFVGGRSLIRQGALQADGERTRNLALTARERVAAATGLMAGAGTGASE